MQHKVMGTIIGIIEEHDLILQATINKIRLPAKPIMQKWVQVPRVVFGDSVQCHIDNITGRT